MVEFIMKNVTVLCNCQQHCTTTSSNKWTKGVAVLSLCNNATLMRISFVLCWHLQFCLKGVATVQVRFYKIKLIWHCNADHLMWSFLNCGNDAKLQRCFVAVMRDLVNVALTALMFKLQFANRLTVHSMPITGW